MRGWDQSLSERWPESDRFRHFPSRSGKTPHPVVLFLAGLGDKTAVFQEKKLLAGPAKSDEWGRLNHTAEAGEQRKTA